MNLEAKSFPSSLGYKLGHVWKSTLRELDAKRTNLWHQKFVSHFAQEKRSKSCHFLFSK
jgi:hypothetical protein